MIRSVVVTAAVTMMVVVAPVMVVSLAFGVLVMVAGRVVSALTCLSDAPAEGQSTGRSKQSGHACGSLDHRCSFFARFNSAYYPNGAEVHASFGL